VNGKVSIYDKTNLTLIKALEYESVTAIDMSPTGEYLVLIQKPAVTNNLKIINLKDFSEVSIYII
jgi:hypothetical protein